MITAGYPSSSGCVNRLSGALSEGWAPFYRLLAEKLGIIMQVLNGRKRRNDFAAENLMQGCPSGRQEIQRLSFHHRCEPC